MNLLPPSLFVEVILPLALPGTFTYHVPEDMHDQLAVGKRVVVQFGKQKIYTAIIKTISAQSNVNVATKPLMSVLDDLPVLSPVQFEFWQWLSNYYLCTLGEVMSAALPSALRLQSETSIKLHPDFKLDSTLSSDREYLIVEALDKDQQLTIADLSKLLSLKHVMPLIKSMLSKEIILVVEELAERYKPRYATFIRLTEKAKDESFMQDLMAKLEIKASRQLDLLLTMIHLLQESDKDTIAQKVLLKKSNSTTPILQSLVKKGVLEVFDERVDRQVFQGGELLPPLILNHGQQQAYLEVNDAFADDKVVLLHGVTSSGKTEIYIHLLQEAISKGKQALYLVPEIALTTQVINRLQKHFGQQLLVYHSILLHAPDR